MSISIRMRRTQAWFWYPCGCPCLLITFLCSCLHCYYSDDYVLLILMLISKHWQTTKSIGVSGKLTTYPSPKPTFCPLVRGKRQCWLREGVGGQLTRDLNWPSGLSTFGYKQKYWSKPPLYPNWSLITHSPQLLTLLMLIMFCHLMFLESDWLRAIYNNN